VKLAVQLHSFVTTALFECTNFIRGRLSTISGLQVLKTKYGPLLHVPHQNNKRQSQTPVVNTKLRLFHWEELTFPKYVFFSPNTQGHIVLFAVR
jgi:hypothetical protein